MAAVLNLPWQVFDIVGPRSELVERRDAVAPLLAELPEREQRILLLRFVGGMTRTGIADGIGISQMHVSRLLARTLSRPRRALAANRGPPVRRGSALTSTLLHAGATRSCIRLLVRDPDDVMSINTFRRTPVTDCCTRPFAA